MATDDSGGASRLRIGVDLVEIERIAQLAENPAFLQRIYTANELELVREVSQHRKSEILAGRFAIKEAFAKALGTGVAGGLTFRDIETLIGPRGEPVVMLHGKARQLAADAGVVGVKASLSHAGGLAIAFVLLECDQVL